MSIYIKYKVSLMKQLKIKTVRRIEKYNKLKKNKTVIGQIRFYWFNFLAILRDLNK